ncbi:PREDICTED: SWI/SNF-related matrix-associated actin-dependent regulator of chromatin subfamily A-like protein 1 [Cyphomyrmex costatus]|uniref:SWI/SNF-related matrix-associated actin-dependent regulator of chromatin subfamily A-like protein 1 n=1 Tax=Cyphomyrmex costatus TaxID=456900 RepID=UPI000852254F|nr:PREDICTED: SWI/SNF-related matrix-associated actin-dependent regulator of chromatin subfamily A-like protein 1 [Cyphomyrmex costatus]
MNVIEKYAKGNKIDKMCTPEQIEKKRLLALERRQQSQFKIQSTPTSNQICQQPKLNDNENIAQRNKTNNRFNPIEPRKFFNQMLSVTGKCYMISDDRFALEISTFVPDIIATFKTVPSRIYDLKSKIWNFHIKDYNSLLQTLSSKHCNLSITKIPEAVLRIFRRNLKSENQLPEQDLSRIDKTLIETLMPFQREGVCYGISKNGRCMIADDMGLGKTIQALGIAHYYKESWPLLIVAPSSVKYQWSQAIYEFLPSVPTHFIHHFANTKDHIGDDKITITSYELLVRAVNTFDKHIFGFIILAELYTQINLIIPRFMSYEDYGIRYCAGQRNEFGWNFIGSSNTQELQVLLKSNCMIRRLKSDVLNQLPSKIRKVIILDSTLIKAGTKQMRELSQEIKENITGLEKHNTLIKYYAESSYARLKAVCHYVTNLFENKTKCLLYAHHRVVLDAICKVAESNNIKYIRIDGSTNSEQRKHLIDTFQERDDYTAAILSITAANAGFTLTTANLVVFTELFWNPGILCQAEDRVHRIGQNDTVTIQYLIAENTADDYIWPLIKKKMNVLNSVGLDQDFSVNNVDIITQKKSKQQDLTSFLNISSSSEKGSQSQHDMEISPAIPVSPPNDVKDLLEIDDECFDSCDWDNIM